MKQLVFVVILALALPVWAQPKKGSVEIGLSGTAGSLKHETESDDKRVKKSNSLNYVTLFARPAYYVIPQLSIEPEIIWAIADEDEPAFDVSLNVAYNVHLKNPQILPFVLAGYGRGNSMIMNNMALYKNTDGLEVSVFNVGAGLKTYVKDHVALRVEYRYQNRQYDSSAITVGADNTFRKIDVTEKYLSSIIMFGFSYLF